MKTKEKIVFGVIILSHGRAIQCKTKTYNETRKCGYTGPIRVVIDNEDTTREEYEVLFPGEVIVFDKKAVAETIDVGDNFEGRRSTVYVRTASFEIAKELGWTHFIQLDDDYFDYRYTFASTGEYNHIHMRRLDSVWLAMAEFVASSPERVKTICMSQGGDFMGGQASGNLASINLGRAGKRKAMNTWVCQTNRPFKFLGKLNEDVNTYVVYGKTGDLFFTSNSVRHTQIQTQTIKGGMSDAYNEFGTYVKSFYTVMYAPSAVKVYPLVSKFGRLHHRINWNNAVPKILREEVKKK